MTTRQSVLAAVNKVLRPLQAEIAPARELARLRSDERTRESQSLAATPLPEEARTALHANNPRLGELVERYRAAPSAVTGHSLWTPQYIESQVGLQDYRGDNAYVYQFRDGNTEANHLLTAYYLASMDKLGLFDLLSDDTLFGAAGFSWQGDRIVTRDLLDSIAEIDFLDHEVGLSERSDYHILDIGAGYGRFAQRLVQAFPGVSAYATDALAVSTFLCEFNLNYRGVSPRAQAMPLDELDALFARQQIDLATNIHSFSECSLSAVTWWLDLLRDNHVPLLMIAPNSDGHGGTRLTALEADGERVDFVPELNRRGYQLAQQRPKFTDESMQRIGISPTQYYLFELHS